MAGEAPEETLVRELREEVGIEVLEAEHLIRVDRPDELDATGRRKLRIEAYRIRAWEGEPKGREGQLIEWMSLAQMRAKPCLRAVWPINEKLRQIQRSPTKGLADALGRVLVAIRDLDMGYPQREVANLGDAVRIGLANGVEPKDIDCSILRAHAPEVKWGDNEERT